MKMEEMMHDNIFNLYIMGVWTFVLNHNKERVAKMLFRNDA